MKQMTKGEKRELLFSHHDHFFGFKDDDDDDGFYPVSTGMLFEDRALLWAVDQIRYHTDRVGPVKTDEAIRLVVFEVLETIAPPLSTELDVDHWDQPCCPQYHED